MVRGDKPRPRLKLNLSGPARNKINHQYAVESSDLSSKHSLQLWFVSLDLDITLRTDTSHCNVVQVFKYLSVNWCHASPTPNEDNVTRNVSAQSTRNASDLSKIARSPCKWNEFFKKAVRKAHTWKCCADGKLLGVSNGLHWILGKAKTTKKLY